MGKNILLLIAGLFLTLSISAQTDDKDKKIWFDLQLGQHIGLNKWNDVKYANDGLPAASLTELRGVGSFYLAGPYFGAFLDMGLGVMPAPKMKSLDRDRMPMPNSGMRYYMREPVSESGQTGASARFRITGGLFGDFRVSDKLGVMPYIGAGGLTMSRRRYEMVLKEDGTNIQYDTKYLWGKDSESGSDMMGYFTARLNFRYRMNGKTSLLLGLEYTSFFDPVNFYARFTNSFNGNINREMMVKGNKMNMLALTVGLSFR